MLRERLNLIVPLQLSLGASGFALPLVVGAVVLRAGHTLSAEWFRGALGHVILGATVEQLERRQALKVERFIGGSGRVVSWNIKVHWNIKVI